MDIVYCIVKEFNKDISSIDQGYQAKINRMIQRYERSHPSLMIPSQATPQNMIAGVQPLEVVDNYQQKRSQPQHQLQDQHQVQHRKSQYPQRQPQMWHQEQQQRSQYQQDQPQDKHQVLQQQQEQTQPLQLQINNLVMQFQQFQSTVITEQQKSHLLSSTLAAEQERSQSLERRCSSIESSLVAEQEKSRSLEAALVSEQEKSQSIESALASEQEKSRSLEARCQTLESSLAAEQQRSQSRYQNHEERLIEVEDIVEQLWSISRDEVNLTNKIIGTGGWGYVTEANFRGRRVAAKCLHTAITSQHNQQLFAKEMKMFARCRHRNLLEFIGAVPDHPAIIVTELMDTNLREALIDGSATPNHIHPICMHVAQALLYLHGILPHPLIHRDVSAPNVLLKAVSTGWIAKLSDLGSAQFANIAQTLAPGCVVYAAPEVRQESSAHNQTTKMDVYSYGVLIIEILIRQMPLGNVADLITTIQPTWPTFVPLIRQCTTNEPSRRPTMIQVTTTLNTITI
ncbi:probable serine/threonine-protein kinase DDB_G0271682 [Dysidea avara]|uniref:probable serine/threonine-protein kinase DDB_G0271682 n=1 Tax=Dysidea avara TaxID=196820 RepID=UPI0033329BF6